MTGFILFTLAFIVNLSILEGFIAIILNVISAALSVLLPTGYMIDQAEKKIKMILDFSVKTYLALIFLTIIMFLLVIMYVFFSGYNIQIIADWMSHQRLFNL